MSMIFVHLQDKRAVFQIFIALLRFSFDSPLYKNNIEINLKALEYMGMDWIQVAWKWIHLIRNQEPVGSINLNEFLDYLRYNPLLHSSASCSPSVCSSWKWWTEAVGGENSLHFISTQATTYERLC
jgi:hypothetical protein